MFDLIAKSKALILGFGVEGQATLRYLQEKFPKKEFVVADKQKVPLEKGDLGGLKPQEEQKKSTSLIKGDIALTFLEVIKEGKDAPPNLAELPPPTPLVKGGFKNIEFHCGSGYLKNLDQYDFIIKSPGIKSNLPELLNFKKNGGKITSATNIFMSVVQGNVIGVTGSKGKSTTASLIYTVLKEAGKKVFLIGNIGNPALDELKNDSPETFYVYEMSSYQLEDLVIKPPYALVTNLFPEHLDYHGGVKAYYEAKMGIVGNQITNDQKEQPPPTPPVATNGVSLVKGGFKKTYSSRLIAQGLGNTVFYNAGCDELNKRIKAKNCQKIPFNDGKNSKIEDDYLVYQGEKIVAIKDIKLLGRHNLENILGVIAVSKELGVGSREIREAVKNFKGLEHRLEYVGNFQKINFYNDSISTTPESTIQAIYALGDKLETIILGGMDRGYDFSELAKVILKSQIKNVILFPETGEKIQLQITNYELRVTNKKDKKIQQRDFMSKSNFIVTSRDSCLRRNDKKKEQNPPTPLAKGGFKKAQGSKPKAHSLYFFSVSKMQDCVKMAFQKTAHGKICLLSPASPSYNLFKNFQERGDLYKKFITKLTKD